MRVFKDGLQCLSDTQLEALLLQGTGIARVDILGYVAFLFRIMYATVYGI